MNRKDTHTRHGIKSIARIAFGILFLALGVVGLFLPVLQGILFIIVGLLLLAPYSRCIRRLIASFRRKYPALHRAALAVKKKAASIFHRS
jgi:uncharacterized membrane protein YbaN (DUF454 family)